MMKLRDESLFESYMRYENRIRQFAETWTTSIEVAFKSGFSIEDAIASTHNLITFGTDLTLSALQLIIQYWKYGDAMAEWYDSLRLLINI